MGIKYCKQTRRQFLLGSGGAMLSLPLLPSLIPRVARAQAASAIAPKMMFFHFDHNNFQELWPQKSVATQDVGSFGTKEVSLRSLGPIRNVATPLRHNIYQSLANSDLITFFRGFEHSGGGPAHGNAVMAAGEGRSSEGNHPSLDSIIENSSAVYPSGTASGITRALRVGGGFYEAGSDGNPQQLPAFRTYDVRTMYNDVFTALSSGTVTQAELQNGLKGNILNRVLASYNSFANGRRISSADKDRLTQHMDHLSDLQRGITSVITTSSSCTRPSLPSGFNNTDRHLAIQLYMQLLAVAFKCGLTKYSAFSFEAHNPSWIPGFNLDGKGMHGCIHGTEGADLQRRAYSTFWNYYSDMVAQHFLSNLNEEEGSSGKTYIENMITSFNCCGGMINSGTGGGHSGRDNQQILFGSMGGKLRSGNYYFFPPASGAWPGMLPYNSYLVTKLHLMGVPPSHYQHTSSTGNGFGYYDQYLARADRYGTFFSRMYSPLSEVLT